LMVMHFMPAHRCVALLESLTGASPSVGFVHGLLARAAGLLAAPVTRVRALIAKAHAVCCDETPQPCHQPPNTAPAECLRFSVCCVAGRTLPA
jgi:Transposase IS66 family